MMQQNLCYRAKYNPKINMDLDITAHDIVDCLLVEIRFFFQGKLAKKKFEIF